MNNEIRWSFNYEVLKHYLEIKDFLPLLSTEEIDDLMLSSSENNMVQRFCLRLKELKEVMVDLQKVDTTSAKVRTNSDSVLEHYQRLSSRIGTSAEIVDIEQFGTEILMGQEI